MSQIPDGIGQVAYPLISNAGPPESGLLSDDSIYSLASTGQEQQLYNLTDSSSSYVPDYDLQQQQLQRPATVVQQLHLQAESEQIEIDYQQADEPQAQPDSDVQRLLPEECIRYLSYGQTGPNFEAYSEEIAYQEQFITHQGQRDIEFHIPVAAQHQIPDYNQNLIRQPTQEHTLLVPETETQVNQEVEVELELSGEEQIAQPEQFLAKESQYRSADQKEEEEEDQYQPESEEEAAERRREQLFLDFANCSPEEYIEPIKRPSYLESITNRVHKSLEFLRENCERLKEEPEPEQELIQLQIIELSELRENLVHVCPHLIDNPNPKAWTLLKEIILGIDCFTFTKQQGEGAVEVWKHNPSAVQADPMGLELLYRIRKIITGWYHNDSQSDPDEAGSGSGPAGDQQQRNSRKRRIAEDEPSLIKYRRVDNSFPRFIPNEIGEEHIPNTYMAGREMDNQRQYSKRLSIFNSPTFTQRTVRNNASNINIDLSDDDDPRPSFGLGASNRPSMPTGLTSMNPDSSNCPLPMRSQMLYSDAVRLGQNGFPESRMNGHPSSIRSPVHEEDTLLKREDRRSEHEQYLALLRNLCHNKSSIRAINNKKPPPLQLIYKPTERSSIEPSNTWRSSIEPSNTWRSSTEPSNTWRSILANNKPPLSRQAQQPPSAPTQPPKPVVSGIANLEFADYAKLLARQQQKITPPVPPIKRIDSAKSVTSHASSISISESTSSSSNSSNASNAEPANDNSSDGQAAALRASKTTADHSKSSRDTYLNTTVSRSELMQRRFESCVYFSDSFPEDFIKKMDRQREELEHQQEIAILQAEKARKVRREYEKKYRANKLELCLSHKPLLFIGPIVERTEDKKEAEFIPFTEEHMKRFSEIVNGSPYQVIVSKFSLQITRNDIRTLLGSSWLNDEVINFYMNLLTERSELRSGEVPSVYAMNTFFVPRLLQNGHGGVKRWTRRVDLFSKDVIPVPVHCNGVHWCMAIIHMRNKTIRYYDSMGKPNQDVLDALEMYLRQESLDKRKQPFDTSDFKIESVPNVPQQTNGSDCGVFSCMFAEYISRDAPITFSQDNMDYFRKKMVLEIADGKLWK